jgi:hypothetical protein
MDTSLVSLINLHVFSTGRRIFAHEQVLAAAKQDKLSALSAHVTAAIKADRATLELEHGWAAQPAGTPTNPAVVKIDSRVDRVLTAIRDHAVQQAAGADSDEPVVATVDGFLAAAFPAGLVAMTSAAFAVESVEVQTLLGKLTAELAPAVKELGLARLVTRLDKVANEYRASLQAPSVHALAFDDVKAARLRGQSLLLETVAIVLGNYHGSSDEDAAARQRLLGPILVQNEAIGRALKTRHGLTDVNPDTGAEVPAAQAATTGAPTGSTGH